MNQTASLTRQMLEEILIEWERSAISSLDIHLWAESQYLPLHRAIGPGETEAVRWAMHVILNELDMANPKQLNRHCARLAIQFLNTTDEEFTAREEAFLSCLLQ
ncbi:MAG: hypothetical protein AAFY57_04330 [Cyanobacteria bacterium J06642_2]